MIKPNLAAKIFILTAASIGLAFFYPQAIIAQNVKWTRGVSDVEPNEQLTNLDGSIHSLCAPHDMPKKIKSFDRSGMLNSSVGDSTPESFSLEFCQRSKAVDRNNVVYGMNYPKPYDTGGHTIVAFREGIKLWGTVIDSTTVCKGIPINLENARFDPSWMQIGADGYLYVLSEAKSSNCRNRSYVAKIRPSNGEVIFNKEINSDYSDDSIEWFSAYNDGLVLYDRYKNEVRYFDFNGNDTGRVPVDLPANYDGFAQASTSSGRVYFTVRHTINRPPDCNSHQVEAKIVAYSLEGNVFEHDVASCRRIGSMVATPQNNIAYLHYSAGQSGIPEHTLVRVKDNGAVIQDQPLQHYNNEGTRMLKPENLMLYADMKDNVLLTQNFRRNTDDLRGTQFTLYKGDSNEVIRVTNTDEFEPHYHLSASGLGLADDQLYFSSYRNCHAVYCVHENSSKQLYAINFPGIGMDYPRGAILEKAPRSSEIKYLALGDSFSSGEGDTRGDLYYLPGTDGSSEYPNEKCHVSQRSYPYLLSAHLGLPWGGPAQGFANVGCAGAVKLDVTNDSDTYPGQFDILTADNQQIKKDEALKDFFPGRAAQIEFVKKYKPKVVTIGIGGNDIGFKEKLEECIISVVANLDASCAPALTETNARANIGVQIKNDLHPKLVTFYEELKQVSANTKVYAVGYPNIIKTATACPINVQLDDNERRYAVELLKYLNIVIKDAALEAGVGYIDIENSLQGTELCSQGDANGEVGVNGITLGNDIFGMIGNESYHPNQLGHRKMASVIKNIFPNQEALNNDPCATHGPTLCASGNDAPPALTSYFTYSTDPLIKTIFNRGGVKNLVQIPAQAFNASVGLLAPGSNLYFELHSDPVNLGSFTADADGKVQAQLTIPAGTEPGYHQLHAVGTSASGEPIDYYDHILVAASEFDYDGDGIFNVTDKCNFMQPANQDADKDGTDDACDEFIDKAPLAPTLNMGSTVITAANEKSIAVSGEGEADTTAKIIVKDYAGNEVLSDETHVQAVGNEPASYTKDLDFSALGDGRHTLSVTLSNQAGTSPAATISLVKDVYSPPEIEAAITPAPNAKGWNKSDATLTLTATDPGAGVKDLTYSTSGAQTIPETTITDATAFFTIVAEGDTTITYRSTDNDNNAAQPQTKTIRLDKVSPTTVLNLSSTQTTTIKLGSKITGTSTDTRSRPSTYTLNLRNTSTNTTNTRSATCTVNCATTQSTWSHTVAGLPTGNYQVTAHSTDKAGNQSATTTTRNIKITN